MASFVMKQKHRISYKLIQSLGHIGVVSFTADTITQIFFVGLITVSMERYQVRTRNFESRQDRFHSGTGYS